MTLSSDSLATVLKPFAKNNYKFLFSSGGFLINENGKWKVNKLTPKDLLAYYSSLSSDLIASKDYRKIPKLKVFIEHLNSHRTLVEFPSPPIVSAKAHHIFFNSKTTGFKVFSNFYETLVFFQDHIDPSIMTLYPSSENAYQVHKVVKLSTVGAPSSADSAKKPPSIEFQKMLEKIAKASPLTSKRLAKEESKEAVLDGASKDRLAREKFELMKKINASKYSDNPVLASYLKSTKELDLIEDSSDRFWGAKDPKDRSLKKNWFKPVDAHSRNIMGRILMVTRKQLSSKT